MVACCYSLVPATARGGAATAGHRGGGAGGLSVVCNEGGWEGQPPGGVGCMCLCVNAWGRLLECTGRSGVVCLCDAQVMLCAYVCSCVRACERLHLYVCVYMCVFGDVEPFSPHTWTAPKGWHTQFGSRQVPDSTFSDFQGNYQLAGQKIKITGVSRAHPVIQTGALSHAVHAERICPGRRVSLKPETLEEGFGARGIRCA